MPKSNLKAAVEKISERIAKKVLRECRAFGTMGTWIKTLQDDNRTLKNRVQELEIRVKKLNTYGPTPPDPIKKKRGQHGTNTAKRKMIPARLRQIRTKHKFSQSQFALLLGIKTSRYSNWEDGHSRVPSKFEEKIRELHELKALELRTRMHSVGIFQPNGRPASLKQKETGATPSVTSSQAKANNKTVNKAMPEISVMYDQDILYLPPVKLKEIRQELGLTQRQLALLLGITSNRYGNWECGIAKAAPLFVTKIMELKNMPISEREIMMLNAFQNANKIKSNKPHRKTGKK